MFIAFAVTKSSVRSLKVARFVGDNGNGSPVRPPAAKGPLGMHRLVRFLAGTGMFALALAGLVSFGRGAAAQSEVVGHLYVNDNTATTNTIESFDRHADGSLTPTPGSPFATGGAGTGTIIGSQGALQITADGRFLLAVDAGSNQISVLSVAEDGALTAIDGGTVDSGGKTPVSIAVHEDLVYVANTGDGTDGASYAGFRLSDEGILSPIDGSTMPLSATAAPG